MNNPFVDASWDKMIVLQGQYISLIARIFAMMDIFEIKYTNLPCAVRRTLLDRISLMERFFVRLMRRFHLSGATHLLTIVAVSGKMISGETVSRLI
jgi:hypothetical protein